LIGKALDDTLLCSFLALENSLMKYSGSCHCQAVQFESEFELNTPALCNCSYCSKRNAIVHVTDNVKILRGADQLQCYRFNKMKGQHYFCVNCGIFIYLIPPEPIFPYAVNLCALENCDWKAHDLFHFNGKEMN